ncbi:helix-turn-helix domain-containing protein [Sodalis sp. C49]|uniref:helix-turn-helix domain-containing protein n=1 Tax=unclassified Sodalis (in: enterobacteria) TaxID=2636512 RepID=UPI003965CE52
MENNSYSKTAGIRTALTTEQDFGKRIKAMRVERRWTLEQVAKNCGVSISTLSKIENGQVSASFDTITKIANAFDLSFSDLFRQNASSAANARPPVAGRRTVTRAGEGLVFTNAHYIYNVHAEELTHKGMIPIVMQITAREAPPQDQWSCHEGEEFIYAISGTTILHTAWYAPLCLLPGDSAYIDSSMPHAFVTQGEQDASILSICLTDKLDFEQHASAAPL